MSTYCVIKDGVDYSHPEVVAVCETREAASEILDHLPYDGSMFPWNYRAVVEVPVGKVLDWVEVTRGQ